MKLIIKLFSEIVIKSKSVRLRFIKILTRNIRNIIKNCDDKFIIMSYWDHIEIKAKNEIQYQNICDLLVSIPGIHHILEVEDIPFISLENIFEIVLDKYKNQIEKKTFCVRVKRRGKHEFTSIEVERYIGAELNKHVKSASVKLVNQDVTINLEIRDNLLFLVKNRYEGVGGFPIGTQGDVISLISGGFDSSVSSYMLIRRGCRVHYCFFNISGIIAHEVYVQQIARYLWDKFGSSHSVRFISINFEPVVNEIIKKVEDSQMGVILKRMMIRAVSKIAEFYGIQALVTGEVIGQVSSQTLNNLRLIDAISSRLILRPLISYDKEYIVNLTRKIGTESFVRNIPEYCSVISKNPTVKAIKSKIEAEEAKFDFSILDVVIKNANSLDINKIVYQTSQRTLEIETIKGSNFGINDIILDIRSTYDKDNNPLKINGIKVISLPFYKLRTKFSELDQSKTWLLWCDKGIMSRLQALYLREQGFTNVKVYYP